MDRYISMTDTMNSVSAITCVEVAVIAVAVAVMGGLALLHHHARALRWRWAPSRVEKRTCGQSRPFQG